MPNHDLTRRNELNARPMLGVGYARMARLSVPRVTSVLKRPSCLSGAGRIIASASQSELLTRLRDHDDADEAGRRGPGAGIGRGNRRLLVGLGFVVRPLRTRRRP